ncbi:hypothetical protein [Natrinema sp. 1APR25-10V2]|uniref:hypothetical protein n=1 Tax=Natrinema sp. 1APR25-10V2 TaxID=2951081 RepID=UPI0031F31F97
MKDFDHWALWSPEFGKQIIAPWVTGHCYPASWGEQATERPETEFRKAKMLADLPPREVHQSYPFPPKDGSNEPHIPDRLIPTFLLLHDPPEPPVMQVDFDDVRDAETGRVTEEVREIVDRLDAFTEISQSGEGLHVFVRAELPGGLGKFIADLDEAGAIEMYDHGRIVGATWEHVDGTPTTVPERQDVVEELIETYESEQQRDRRERRAAKSDADSWESNTSGIEAAIRNRETESSDRSPYFDIDIRSVADTGEFRRYRSEAPGDQWQGPHPDHGPIHSAPGECTNFGIDPTANTWFCFAHESGGRAIELAAVLADEVDVCCRDLPSNAAQSGWLGDRPLEMLKTCLWLRDRAGIDDETKPPHAALLGVSDLQDVHVRDRDQGILGERNAELCQLLFDELSVDDV